LAVRVGTKQANISRIENGLANPTVEFLQKLARALGTELEVSLKVEKFVESTQIVIVHSVKQAVIRPDIRISPPATASTTEYDIKPYPSKKCSYPFNADSQALYTSGERLH
jgi:transcriptional regulator with XRE-family HTH domain